ARSAAGRKTKGEGRSASPRSKTSNQRAPGGASAAPKTGSVVEGTVSANRAGYGFVRVEGMKDSIFLPPNQMRGVMHGDRLRVRVTRDATDRWLGKVEEIVGRGVSAFLATVEVQGRSAWVNSADRRLQLRCAVAHADLNG